jgi:SecD/SecF fusion protein
MQRSFLTRTIICLIPTLLATGAVIWAYSKDPEGLSGFKLGIDLRGGTILEYEVDQVQTRQMSGPGNTGPAKADAALAEAIKRRIDPADLLSIKVAVVDDSRIEIVLPYGAPSGGGKQAINRSDVERIKEILKQIGSLEFRILANDMDDGDRDALVAARDFLRKAHEAPMGEEAKSLEDAAKNGVPPPFPNRRPDEASFLYKNEEIQYQWVELGKQSRFDQGLSTHLPDEKRSELYRRLTLARQTNDVTVVPGSNEEGRLSTIYYSRPSQGLKDPEERKAKQFEYFVLTRISEKNRVHVGGDVTITAYVTQGKTSEPVVGFTFNSRGGEKFYQMTSNNQPEAPGKTEGAVKVVRQLGIILDGKLISSPTLNEPIRNSGIISGRFERTEVERIVNLLRSGALPATLNPIPVEDPTPPTLGAETIRDGKLSIGLAFLAVLVFMIVYYRFAGLVATIALLVNLLLTIGFMVILDATFTLHGLAGLVLMLGMAVDANVLIYERVREERDRGLNLATALRNGYDRALPTIIDTHLSSIFTCLVLYTFGTDHLKGFAVSLTVGLVISLFTSLYMTRLIFDFWQAKGWLTQLRMMRMFSRPSLNFMRIRYKVFAITGALTIAGVALFLVRGEQILDIDFRGGCEYTGLLKEPSDKSKLSLLFTAERQRTRLAVTDVQEIVDPTGHTRHMYEIRYSDGAKTIVALRNQPEGASPESRSENVKRRASRLPDVKIDQPVEASVSRLMQDERGNELLAKNEIIDIRQEGDSYVLKFASPASTSVVKTVLERQFQVKLGDQHPAAGVFTAAGQGEEQFGDYSEIRVEILKDANEGIRNLTANEKQEVLAATKKEFSAKPQPEKLKTVHAAQAADARNRALYAVLASWLAIMLYLWFRFGNWTFGAAAVICLIHDLCFTLGAIAICHYIHDTSLGRFFGLEDFKINLPSVAALLTLVGYSVNDTIVVFDRIKEVRGKSAALSATTINDSVNQTLSRTILASLTTFLVVIVLYIWGGEGVHLFAFVMVVGVIIGTLSSIYVASPLLLIFGEGRVRATSTPT